MKIEEKNKNNFSFSSNIESPSQIELHQEIASMTRRVSSFSFQEEEGHQSTLMTSLVMFNNIIGITIMIFPMVILNCGIFTFLIVMMIIAFINFISSNLYVIHFKNNENNLSEMIFRILGENTRIFCIVGTVIMFFSGGIIFLILLNNMFYSIIIFIFQQCNFYNYAEKSDFRLDIYSYQINSLILLVPAYLSCFMRKMDVIAFLAKIGVYVLISYICFLLYILIDNVNQQNFNEDFSHIPFWTSNIREVSGACCMAFFCQNSICPLIKPLKKKTEKTKAVFWAYLFSYIFYCSVGIIGGFGICGRKAFHAHPQTIMDFFEKDSILPFIIEVLYFLKLTSVFPILCFIAKAELLTVFPNKNNQIHEPKFFSWCYNTIYILCAEMCVLFNIDLTFIIGFTAAVFGFLFIYLFPIWFHLKCYGKNTKEQQFLINIEEEKKACNHHGDKHLLPNNLRALLYLVIMIPIGVYLLVIQFLDLFS